MRLTSILPLLAAVLATVSAHASPRRNTHSPNNPHGNTRRRCGAPEPDNDALDEADIDESSARVVSKFGHASDLNRQAQDMINVRTYVHVITTTMSGTGKYSQDQIDMQLLALNKAYNPHAISFTLAKTSFIANDQWAYVSAESAEELQMKQALRQGTYGDLNLYFIEALEGDILGICSFPKNLQKSLGYQNLAVLDGCMLAGGTMPGGDLTDYNMGGTAIHETGHWFGLFHPFQGNSCSGKGDRLGDTPMQSKETVGCPTQPTNSCPGSPGHDNIHNYMDYSSDPCYSEFTPGQQRRAHTQYNKYRAKYTASSRSSLQLRPAQQHSDAANANANANSQHPHAPHSNAQSHPGKGKNEQSGSGSSDSSSSSNSQQFTNSHSHSNSHSPQHPGSQHPGSQSGDSDSNSDSDQAHHPGAQHSNANDAQNSSNVAPVLQAIPDEGGPTVPSEQRPGYAGLIQYVTSSM